MFKSFDRPSFYLHVNQTYPIPSQVQSSHEISTLKNVFKHFNIFPCIFMFHVCSHTTLSTIDVHEGALFITICNNVQQKEIFLTGFGGICTGQLTQIFEIYCFLLSCCQYVISAFFMPPH